MDHATNQGIRQVPRTPRKQDGFAGPTYVQANLRGIFPGRTCSRLLDCAARHDPHQPLVERVQRRAGIFPDFAGRCERGRLFEMQLRISLVVQFDIGHPQVEVHGGIIRVRPQS
jgi:hypothetical protein